MRTVIVGYPLLASRQWKLYGKFDGSHEVHIITPNTWPTIPTADYPSGESSFKHHALRTLFKGQMNRYVILELLSKITRIDPDVVLTHGEPWQLNTAIVTAICEFTQTPHVIFSWENLNRMPRLRVLQGVEQMVLSRISGIVAGSDQAVDRLENKGYNGQISVAPQTGVDIQAFSPQNDAGKLRERFDLPTDANIVLYTGRLVPEKGLRYLVDAVPGIYNMCPNVHLLLVGEGPMSNKIRQNATNSEHITLVTDRLPYHLMPQLYSLASVFTYPSYTEETWAEQFGYAAAEAMSCGVPVVTTRCGSLPHVVDDGGIVCPERDSNSLAEAIGTLLQNPKRRAELGERARQRVKTEFSLDRVAKRHERALMTAADLNN